MNRVRIFALLIIVSNLFAYRPASPNKKVDGHWFDYIGPQEVGAPASLSHARVRLNYQYATSALPATGTNYLISIFVQQCEIDDSGSPYDLTDDLPKVDLHTTDIYIALGLAKDPESGQWRSVTYNTATVVVGNQPY